jgi:hypothetical protein
MESAGESIRHRVEVRADVKRGVPTLFSTKRDFELASYLPERTLASAQMVVDGPKTYAAFRAMVRDFSSRRRDVSQTEGRVKDEFDAEMAEMRQELGTDMKEILSLVGDEIALAVVPPETGFIPDAYLVVKGKDGQAAERFKQIVEEAFRRTQPRAELRTIKFQGTPISYTQVEESPFFPSMYVDGDRFVMGSNLAAVKRYVQFRMSSAPTLAAKAAFRESMQSVQDGDATGYIWIDWPSVTSFAYGNMSALLPFVVGAESGHQVGPHGEPVKSGPVKDGPVRVTSRRRSSSAEFDFDWAKLPSAETVSKYVPPQIVRVRIDKQGYSLDSRAFF